MQTKDKVGVFLVFIFLFCCVACSSTNPAQKEVEQQAQIWWDGWIAKCDDGYYTKYEGSGLNMGRTELYGKKQAFIQLNQPAYAAVPAPANESEKLNGVELKGRIVMPLETSLRYITFGISTFGNPTSSKWSTWREGPLRYEDRGASPQIHEIKKVKGKWQGLEMEGFTKPQCSEIPKE